jgi:pimeloyl-ACP methyl ester carboxylesterase
VGFIGSLAAGTAIVLTSTAPALTQSPAPGSHLAAWRSGPASDADGGGDRTGFVFLHAVGLSHDSWLPVARRLGEDYPVLAVTMAGFGESELANDHDYSLHTQAARVSEAARQAGFERWVLVGNSVGATVALAAAVEEPERIAGLLLVSPAAYRRGLPCVGRLGCIGGSRWVLRAAPAWALRAAIDVGSGTRGWSRPEHGRRCRRALRRRGGADAFVDSLRALYSHELVALAEHYAAIRCPTLVLRGERDPLIPRWVARRLTGEIPGARFVPLPRLGHFAQEEAPAVIAAYCRQLAEQVRGDQPASRRE